MALADNKGYFWNSERGDRKYDAGSFEKWLKKFFTSGVFANELYTTATTGMGISVSSGYCNCDGKVRLFESPSTFTIATAGATNPRIDTVVIERNDGNREITMKIVQGAYAENPVATAPVREGGIYQLVLAEIYVGVGVSTITQANITDKRTDSSVCGYVTGTVTEISWAQIVAQWDAYIAQFKATREAEFDAWVAETEGDYDTWIAENEADFLAWYDRMKDQLSEDAAGHLQLEIDDVREHLGLPARFVITSTVGATVTVTTPSGTILHAQQVEGTIDKWTCDSIEYGSHTIEARIEDSLASKMVDVDNCKVYDEEVYLPHSTIIVSYPKNATCSLSAHGESTKQATENPHSFIVYGKKTYTITVEYKGDSFTDSVEVTDLGQTFERSVPDPADYPPNDIDTWLWYGNVSGSYSTLSDILADSSALASLMSEKLAVDYLVRCTGWISDICSNQNAMSYIGLNNYCSDTLLSDNTWLDAIFNSTYMESVLNAKVPFMTSNTTPSGVARASSEDTADNRYAWKVFVESDSIYEMWMAGDRTLPQWIEYEFDDEIKVKIMLIAPFFDTHGRCVKDFKYQGSNGQNVYTDILSETLSDKTSGSSVVDPIKYVIDSNIAYKIHRIYVETTYGERWAAISKLQFYGRKDV